MTSRSCSPPPDRRRRSRLVLVLAVAVAVVAALVGCGGDDGLAVSDVADDRPADRSFTIPVGAGEALDAGRPLEVLPAELDLDVGDVLEIVNLDSRGHLVGPFFVGAEETLRQAFSSAGTYEGECTVHPSGQIVVVVS